VGSTIFDRYGGFSSIRRVISSFYDKVLSSPVVSHHFENTDMRALIDHQTQFIAYLTGGPGVHYSDDVLKRVHAPLGITVEEFREMRLLLREAFEDLDFDEADVAEIEAEITARESLIVQTGTLTRS
jgi:hemoglobin